MNKNQTFRIFVVVILVGAILLLAGNQVAWAGKAPNQASPVEENELQSITGGYDANGGGSVKPPPEEIIIKESGTYSIGGFCTITITLNTTDVEVRVHIEHPLAIGIPDRYQRVRQGCHVMYYQSGKRINELTSALGSATICFAALPKKQMSIYFYNIHSKRPTWSSVTTTLTDGMACGPANSTGVYVGTFKKH